jgi:hypothetical protein
VQRIQPLISLIADEGPRTGARRRLAREIARIGEMAGL